MILTANQSAELHPDGIFPGVCVDVINLGQRLTEYKGVRRLSPKVRLVIETLLAKDKRGLLARTYTASLAPSAKLTEGLGSWRGRPIAPGETIDLDRLIGVSCTVVVSHQPGDDGGVFACIDAISRPTQKVVPSGTYDPEAARQRLQAAAQAAAPAPAPSRSAAPAPQPAPVVPHLDDDDEVPF